MSTRPVPTVAASHVGSRPARSRDDGPSSHPGRAAGSRVAALTGPAAALALLAGLFSDTLEPASSPDPAIAASLSAAPTPAALLPAVLDILGGILVAVYGQVLARRVARPGSTAAGVVATLGALTGGTVIVGGALFATTTVGRVFLHAPAPDPATYRYALAAAAAVLVLAPALPAAALITAVSVLGLRHRALPRAAALVGLVLAVLVIASALVVPVTALGLWLLISGVVLAVWTPRADRAWGADTDTPVG